MGLGQITDRQITDNQAKNRKLARDYGYYNTIYMIYIIILQQNSKYSGHLKNLIVGIVGYSGYSGSRVISKGI
jgi:hypothetical protein